MMKVLLVEDDPKVSMTLERVLATDGYEVDSCATGADAVRVAQTRDHDLIILDWMLPDMDGLSVCAQIRESGKAAPVLVLTARGDVEDRVRGLDAGADDYVVKPCAPEELLARLRALSRRTGSPAKLRAGVLEADRLSR